MLKGVHCLSRRSLKGLLYHPRPSNYILRMGFGLSLRRKKPASPPLNTGRPSLSLPDLSQSLQDIHTWTDLPYTPAEDASVAPRRRKPSAVGQNTQFHRPFTPSKALMSRSESFRIPTAIADKRDSIRSTATGRSIFRSARRAKQPAAFNVIVAGGKGVGKTSFVRLLQDDLNPAVESLGLPPPTRCIRSTVIDVSERGLEKMTMKVYDTPGLASTAHHASELVERERGVSGLLRIMEEKLALTLKEETKVVRRQPNCQDQLIHLVIYLLDARKVVDPDLLTDQVVSWSEQDGEESNQDSPAQPRLSADDLDIIERLSSRANVLPILAQVDHLTSRELATAKTAVRRDLVARFGSSNGFGFGVFWDEENLEDPETIDEIDETAAQTPAIEGYQPPSPSASEQSTSLATTLPFAIFTPEPGSRCRKYNWGAADVSNVEHSDYSLLKEAMLGRCAESLRTSTREILYERYRTERLTAQLPAKA